MFVSADRAAFGHVLVDDALNRIDRNVRDRRGDDLAVALQQAHYDGFVIRLIRLAATADKRFVYLDMTLKARTAAEVVIRSGHQLAQFVAHAPSALVSDA